MSRSATSTQPTHPTSTNQTNQHYAEALPALQLALDLGDVLGHVDRAGVQVDPAATQAG
jgi:hypothetical protein